MIKYFLKGTDRELHFGNMIDVENITDTKDGRKEVAVKCVFSAENLQFLLDKDIVEVHYSKDEKPEEADRPVCKNSDDDIDKDFEDTEEDEAEDSEEDEDTEDDEEDDDYDEDEEEDEDEYMEALDTLLCTITSSLMTHTEEINKLNKKVKELEARLAEHQHPHNSDNGSILGIRSSFWF